MPEKIDFAVTGALPAVTRLETMVEDNTAADANKQAHKPYGTCGPNAYNSPPSAGPTIDAVWFAEVDHAIACGTFASSTKPGTRAWVDGLSKARAAPMAATAK
jgi:hypothetical protein